MNVPLQLAAILQDAPAPVKSAAEERLKLWGDYSLADPWFLLAIPVGLLLLWWGRRWSGRDRGRVPVLPGARASASWAQGFGFVVPLFQIGALACVAIALARPLRGSVESSSTTEGVDIALVIDRSGSMAHEDLEQGRSRLEVVKEVVEAFALRRMTDREGAADNCALITFAGYAQLLCPFTLDVDAITGFLRGLAPVTERHEDGTGIGIGLAKAVAVLKETESRSKVIVLLTDGENNIDLITPADAARMAADQEIKVYTVFAGRYVYQPDLFGNHRPTNREIDPTDLKNIARATGGLFFRARDRAELERVYSEIERLERTQRIERHWSETYDLYPWFLVPALVLYAFAWLFASTLLRRVV